MEFKSVQSLPKLTNDKRSFRPWLMGFKNVMRGIYGNMRPWELWMEAAEKEHGAVRRKEFDERKNGDC